MTEQGVAPVHVSWGRIETWLTTHAPAGLEYLNPPVTPEEIEAASHALGFQLPDELVESLACHNGFREWTSPFPGQIPLSVDGIARARASLTEIAAEVGGLEPQPWDDEPWWHPQWIPWAVSADGVYQVIDLRPGPRRGRLGWAGLSGGADFADAWANLPALLHAIAEALCRGGSVEGQHPYLTAADQVWWDDADRRELNGSPLRPAPVWAQD